MIVMVFPRGISRREGPPDGHFIPWSVSTSRLSTNSNYKKKSGSFSHLSGSLLLLGVSLADLSDREKAKARLSFRMYDNDTPGRRTVECVMG